MAEALKAEGNKAFQEKKFELSMFVASALPRYHLNDRC